MTAPEVGLDVPPRRAVGGESAAESGSGLGRVIASSTVAQLASHGLSLAALLVANGLLSRYLGPTGFGSYALVFAYVALVSTILADWGLLPIAAREASQNPEETEAIIASAAALQLMASASAYVLLCAAVALFVGGWQGRAVAIAGLTLLLYPLDVLGTAWQVQFKLVRASWVGIAGALGRLAVIAAALALGASLLSLVVATAAAMTIRYVIAVPALRGCLRWRRLRPEWRRCRPLLAETWPLALAISFISLMNQAPVVILAHLSSGQEVGYFSAAIRITYQVGFLPYIFVATIFPLLSRLAVQDRTSLARQVGGMLRYLALLALPLAAAGLMAARWLMTLLYGPSFAPAGPAFGVLIVQAAMAWPTVLLWQVLIALGKQRTSLLVLAVGALVVLPASVALAAPYGSTGVAAALAMGYLAIGLAMFVALQQELDGAVVVRARGLLVAGGSLLGVTFAASRVLPGLLALGLGLAAYAGVLVLVGVLDRGDLRLGLGLVRSAP